jgi:branched-chain amino acid transport system ATP-binding protein
MTPVLRVVVHETRYGRGGVILHDVFVEVAEQEIVAVLGSNGVGKTTLLRTLSGVLVKARAEVVLDGRDLSRAPAHERVKAGMVHVPEGRRVFRDLTVEENLRVAGYARRTPQGELPADLDKVFEMFPRLRERRGQQAGALSGGEQQMLAIGRGLMSRPRLLMIDEASLGLAPALITQMFQALALLRSEGLAILLVEQNVRESLQLADRAYVLAQGAVAVSGTSADLLEDEQVASSYLGLDPDHAQRFMEVAR